MHTTYNQGDIRRQCEHCLHKICHIMLIKSSRLLYIQHFYFDHFMFSHKLCDYLILVGPKIQCQQDNVSWIWINRIIFDYTSILDIMKLTLVFPWQVFPYHTYILSHHVSNILDELDYISLWIDNTYKAIEKFCTCSNRFFFNNFVWYQRLKSSYISY